jgi:TetR/AcrR family transcriptional regulator, cholesterol catabolism regulator
MAKWPDEISLKKFREAGDLEGDAFWNNVFELHRDKMQIKNPKIAIANLKKIFTATFELSHEKGFQAMSLRDLSRETGISMGGLYAYIGSKNDLASVIAGVLSQTIDQVIGGLVASNLPAAERLRAIIYGEIYSMDILSSWYYFCYMELKGLPKDQQQSLLDLELRFEAMLIGAISQGVKSGEFVCDHPELLASQATAQMEQWHLKKWKFKSREVDIQQYAAYTYDSLLLCLRAKDEDGVEREVGKEVESERLNEALPETKLFSALN